MAQLLAGFSVILNHPNGKPIALFYTPIDLQEHPE